THESVRYQCGDRTLHANISCMPIVEPESIRGLLLVTFSKAIVPKPRTKARVARHSSAEREIDRISALERELQYAKEGLQNTVEELEASNEELKSANEELQSTNEESQSANEELETSREEMQALNEELQTVNAQLQSKVEDLSQANDDMQNLL